MKIKRTKRGSILVLAVIMVVILLIIGLAVIQLGLNARLQAIRSQFVTAAKTAADAGLAHAIHALNVNAHTYAFGSAKPPGQTNFPVPGSDTTFTYSQVTGSLSSGWTVVSTGYAGPGPTQRTVNALLIVENPFIEGSLITKKLLNLTNMTFVTSINTSGNPAYDNVPTRVGSTSISQVYDPGKSGNTLYNPVIIGNNGTINADVVVGVGGSTSLITVGNSTINGSQGPLATEFVYPLIQILPTSLTSGSASNSLSNIKKTNTILNPANSGKYSSISLSNAGINEATLEISGGNVALYVTGDITMSSNTIIQIDTGSSLTIYVDGNIDAQPGCIFNNQTNIPSNFMIYGTNTSSTPQTFNFQPNSNFCGAIYAPNADVKMQPQNNGFFTGACIANSFIAASNCTFQYDKALAALNPNGPMFFTVKRWWEN